MRRENLHGASIVGFAVAPTRGVVPVVVHRRPWVHEPEHPPVPLGEQIVREASQVHADFRRLAQEPPAIEHRAELLAAGQFSGNDLHRSLLKTAWGESRDG